MIKNMVRTSEPKNQKFHKHNEPQPKIRCSYKKKRVMQKQIATYAEYYYLHTYVVIEKAIAHGML